MKQERGGRGGTGGSPSAWLKACGHRACPTVPRAGGHRKVVQTPLALRRGLKLLGSPTPFRVSPFTSTIAKILLDT